MENAISVELQSIVDPPGLSSWLVAGQLAPVCSASIDDLHPCSDSYLLHIERQIASFVFKRQPRDLETVFMIESALWQRSSNSSPQR